MGEGKTERDSNVEWRGEERRNGMVCTQRATLQRWREPLRKGKRQQTKQGTLQLTASMHENIY